MEVAAPPSRAPKLRRALVWLIGLTFSTLAVALVVAVVHGLFPSPSLVLAMGALAAALAWSAVVTLAVGILYAWRAYPQHRMVVVFLAVITGATLLAHAYVIGSPQAYVSASASGLAGTSFSHDSVFVDSTLSGQTLQVTVSPSGDAIANLTLSSNARLTGSGFDPKPTLSSPLNPGSSAQGTWTVPAAASNVSLTLSYLHLTCYSPTDRTYGCIMDEVYYVPAGMGILNGQQCTAGGLAPHYCKMEHPYLVAGLMAVGMAVFGEYDVVGWRIMPVLLGSFSIPLLFGIAWKLSGSKMVAYLSALLLALDIMFFSMSSGALLDVPETFFGLAAFFAYFAGLRVWKFDKYVVAGVLLGVAGLAKETAVFMAFALATYIVFFGEGSRPLRVYSVFKVALVVLIVFSVGLQAYDSALVTASPPGTGGCRVTDNTFLQHVGYMLCYGSGLTSSYLECQGGPHGAGYWCKYANQPGGPPILPTDWLLFYTPIVYFSPGTVTVCPNTVNGVCQGGAYSYPIYAYYGVTNWVETWTVFVWVPLVAYVLFRELRKKRATLGEFEPGGQGPTASGLAQEVRFGAFALVYFLWTYLPYLALLLAERVTYPFYIVPAVPAIAMGCAFWLSRKWFPKWVVAVFLVMVFVFFLVYFPVKEFLPDWVRALLRH